MRFLADLLVRVIIIVTVTDALIFYVLVRGNEVPTVLLIKGHGVPTWLFTVLVILVTLVPLIINILFVFYRFHAWNM